MGFREDAGAWLRSAMGAMKQTDLAETSGVSRETISNILHGHTEADEENLRKLARALGAPEPRVEKVFLADGAAPSPTAIAMLLLRAEVKERVLPAVISAVEVALAPTELGGAGSEPVSSVVVPVGEVQHLALKEQEAGEKGPRRRPGAAPQKRRRASGPE